MVWRCIGVVWCGVVWCIGVVWCGVVHRRGVVWCGVCGVCGMVRRGIGMCGARRRRHRHRQGVAWCARWCGKGIGMEWSGVAQASACGRVVGHRHVWCGMCGMVRRGVGMVCAVGCGVW